MAEAVKVKAKKKSQVIDISSACFLSDIRSSSLPNTEECDEKSDRVEYLSVINRAHKLNS